MSGSSNNSRKRKVFKKKKYLNARPKTPVKVQKKDSVSEIKVKINKSNKKITKYEYEYKIKYIPEDESFISKVLNLYKSGISTNRHRIIRLNFFGMESDKQRVFNDYSFDIAAMNWLCNPDNEYYLISENVDFLEKKFGKDAIYNYAVSPKMKLKDMPASVPSRAFEKYIFMHDDEFLDAMVNCPKLPIETWHIIDRKGTSTKFARKVLMNIDGQIMLGEMIKYQTRQASHVCVDERSGSSMALNVYYRGLADGKFNVERWDYIPLSLHKNKLDEKGRFCVFGNVPKNTTYSHRHVFDFRQRLIFGKNNSADVRPLPINENTLEEEKKYENFDDFCQDFEQRIHFIDAKINQFELEHYGLKFVGEKYCPLYDSKEKKVVRVTENFKDIAFIMQDESEDNLEQDKINKENDKLKESKNNKEDKELAQ